MNKRDAKGRFIAVQEELADNLFTTWRIIKILPLLFVAYCVWRYLRVTDRLGLILLDMACGSDNCRCCCSAPGGEKNGL